MEMHVNDLPCLYFSATDDGVIRDVNNTLCVSLGYEKEDLTGKKVDTIFTIATRIFQQTHFFPLLKMQGHAEEIYLTLLKKDGDTLPVLINSRRKEKNGVFISGYAGIVVNNRKKFEDELVSAKKAAQAALNENTALAESRKELQKHAELLDEQLTLVNKQNAESREFSRLVTHDLQEPLRKLLLFSNMLAEHEDEATVRKCITRIQGVSEQMRSILSGLQQYVWLTEASFVKTDLDLEMIITNAVTALKNDHPATDISLEIEKIPVIEGDEEQMSFLLKELAANAFRFRRPEVPLKLTVRGTVLLINKFRKLSGHYKYTHYLKLDFSDNGTGFEPAFREQAFELFRRLHSSAGRGVGLSLCRKIMENHGGTIAIDTLKGSGTTVSIWLPVQEPLPQEPVSASAGREKTGTS